MKHILSLIKQRRAKVAVVGLGQVGLFQALEFVRAGFQVIGVDIHRERVRQLSAGQSPVSDIPDEDVAEARRKGLFEVSTTTDFSVCDIINISVSTPVQDGQLNLWPLAQASATVAEYARPGQLFIMRSTVFPGTTERLLGDVLRARGVVPGQDVAVAAAPERCNVGSRSYLDPALPRVVGGLTPTCTDVATECFKALGVAVVPVSLRVAEMSKIFENIFRFVNIALSHELDMLCEQFNLDTYEVLRAASTKPFGFIPFFPAAGIGGTHMLSAVAFWLDGAARCGLPKAIVHAALQMNQWTAEIWADRVANALNRRDKSLVGCKVLVVGVAYKPNVNQWRDSAAVALIRTLQSRGAELCYHDPWVPEVVVGCTVLRSVPLSQEVLQGADCVVATVRHDNIPWLWLYEHSNKFVDACRVVEVLQQLEEEHREVIGHCP